MKNQNSYYTIAITLVIAAGIFFRFWQLNTIPPGIQYDEAYNGINAIQANETGNYKVFYPENFGREGFHLNITALFVKIFGAHGFSIRLANALWGSLTILGFFLLLRELKLSRLSAFMGTFMLAFSFWHLNFSRTAYRAIMVPLLLTWLSYFFFKGLHDKKHRHWYFALAGVCTGLGFHTYLAFRVVPLIVIAITVAILLTEKNFLQEYWRSALIYIFSAFIVMLPMVVYFINHRADLTSRTAAVSVFNAPDMTFPQALGKSLGAHLGSFFFVGDSNPRHNFNSQTTIPVAWSVLLGLGFVISLKELYHTLVNYIKNRKKKTANIATALFYPSLLAQSIFWVMLIPGVLSIEGIPHALRIIGTIPAVFLLAVLPFEKIYHLYERISHSSTLQLKPWRWNILRFSIGGLIAIILAAGLMQVTLYFQVWAKDAKTLSAFEKRFYDLGLLIKQLSLKTNNYIITTQNIAVSADHKESSMKTVEYLGYPNIKNYRFYHPLEGRFEVNCENTLLVFQEADAWLREQFRDRCPKLKEAEIKPEGALYSFWIMH